jgi:sarcosine oxidase, subunit beta
MAVIRADAIVLGAGIAGASTALHLRRKGLSVLLLERDLAGQRASGVNFGGVRQQGRALGELPLARRARRLWAELPRLIGTDGEFTVTGHLRLARSEADMEVIEQHCREAAGFGLDFEPLGRNAIRARFPWLGELVVGGSLAAEDGQANPRLVSPAFAEAARGAGVEILERTEITGGAVTAGEFCLTTADGREFASPRLFNCAGAWAGKVAGWFGEAVALKPEIPQILVTEPLPHRIGPRARGHRRRSLSAPDRARQCALRRRRRPHFRRLVDLPPRARGCPQSGGDGGQDRAASEACRRDPHLDRG